MDFLYTRAELLHERVDVAVDPLVKIRILNDERRTGLEHAQHFLKQRQFIRLTAHLVKDKIAHRAVERFIHKRQLRRVARAEGDVRRHVFQLCVLLALALAVSPHFAPTVNADDAELRPLLRGLNRQRAIAAADIQQHPFAGKARFAQALDHIVQNIALHLSARVGKRHTRAKHIIGIHQRAQRKHRQHRAEPAHDVFQRVARKEQRQRRRQADHHHRIRNPVAILRSFFAKIRRFVLHSEIILSIVSCR